MSELEVLSDLISPVNMGSLSFCNTFSRGGKTSNFVDSSLVRRPGLCPLKEDRSCGRHLGSAGWSNGQSCCSKLGCTDVNQQLEKLPSPHTDLPLLQRCSHSCHDCLLLRFSAFGPLPPFPPFPPENVLDRRRENQQCLGRRPC